MFKLFILKPVFIILATASLYALCCSSLFAQGDLSKYGFQLAIEKPSQEYIQSSQQLFPISNTIQPTGDSVSGSLVERKLSGGNSIPVIDQNYINENVVEPINSDIVRKQQPAALATSVSRYSLGDMLRQTIGQHPIIAKARADYERSMSNSRIAKGEVYPEITVQGSYNFKDSLGLKPNESNPANEVKYNGELKISQSLNFGRHGFKVRSAEKEADGARERFFDTQDQVALEAALAYVQIFRYYNKYKIGIDYINLLVRIDTKVRARSSAGYTNALEEKKLNVLRQRILAENEFNRRQYETALVYLSNVSAIPNLNVRMLKDFNFRIPTFAFSESQIIERAGRTNRGVIAASYRVEAAEKSLSEAKSKLAPTFDLEANVNRQEYFIQRAISGPIDNSVKINFKYSIWAGNKKLNDIRAKEWNMNSEIANLQVIKLQLKNQIQSAYTGYTVSLSELRHSENARKKAMELLRLQEQDFSLGTGSTLLDLINTTTEWHLSSMSEIDAYFEILSRYLQIKRFIGEILDNNI